MPVYATATDYTTWTGLTPPSNMTQILRMASGQVREATELDFYAVDSSGLPADATKLQAFNDATCCQAGALVKLGIDPNAGGSVVVSVKESKAIGSGKVTYASADAQAAAEAKKRATEGLVPEALKILKQAQLAKNAAWIAG